ncbi:unnamed protein product [Phyllotreta striolata]|uniref:C2H2-type domain-containing protein n=1 Tax=Phyllotreta striolata TaxID=444603 RepID=A0A9N9TFB9_PHYSR|nr:unnamed protein product [Phyllotreta striolata]
MYNANEFGSRFRLDSEPSTAISRIPDRIAVRTVVMEALREYVALGTRGPMADDEYNNKLRSLQQYIPFLENMITQLKDPSKKNREQQLNKMESLYAMITDKKKKLKLETLNKCEDVITKLFEKVNHKTLNINTVKKDQTYSPQSTPASPSPEPNDYVNPTTIPTERLEPKSHLPKVDIYSSAAESLRKLNTCNKESLPAFSAKCPDLTKPPISLDDLRCLEVDVQVKINENASLSELKKMRNKIATELMFEDIKSISKPGNAESSRSGLDRSNKPSTVACSGSSSDKICTKKFEPITIKPKPVPRTLKEPHSVFGNVLSNIDEKLYEENKKKTERRSSASKEESITKDNESKRERRHSKETRVEKDEKKGKNIRSDDKGSKDRTTDRKDSKEENIICIDKTAESNTTKSNTEPSSNVKNTKYYDLTGTKSFKGKESPCAKTQTLSTSSINRTVIIIDDDDSPANDKNDQPIVIDDNSSPNSKREESDRAKTDQSQTTQEFRRLADKYNPKPRKRSVDVINVEEEIVNVMSPIPSITISPDPPPHLATCTSQPFDKEFVPFKTNSSLPAQPRPFVTSAIPNQVQSSHQSTMDNFVSEYAREEFQSVNRRPNHLNVPLGHSPILMSPKDNFPSDSTRENFGSSQHRRFNYEPTSHHRYGPPPPNQRYFKNFNQKFREPPMLDFQPPNNIPLTQNNPSHHVYDHRPPVLSPETPHYREPKHNFGNHMNRDTFLPKDDLRWRLGDSRTPWDRSEHESRFRGPMTYKEHREMRENSRDPRLLRDPRNNRERLTSPENKSRECRDTFKNKETEPVQNTRDPRVNRDYTDSERSKSRYRYDSRFDRLYSATNKDLPSKSFSKETDTFMSPLDSLYSGKETKRTGKGYGVQPFRIPKKKKEGEKDEKESVVDIDNSSQDSEPKVATKESVKQLEPEFIDNSSEIFKETEENDKNVKEDQAIIKTNIEDANIEAIEESATATETNNEQEVSTEPQENNTTKTNEPEKKEERKQPSTEQTILANFFGNLLSSQNKKDKKSALYSLISTFSDTFSTKELAKITKIINANDEDDSSDDQEKVVADKPKEDSKSDEVEQKPVEKDEKVEPSSDVAKEESEPEEEIALPKRRCRTRRISSYTSPTKDKLDDTAIKESVESPVTNDEAESPTDKVVVTVSERIKSRKRGAKKPKKKCRSELDKLHEDIKEMFIRDGVLTASGKRMCNLLKDDPCVLANDTFKLDSNESVKGRKKPVTNLKIADEMAMKAMKNVRVLIQKIPDVEETATVRRLTRSMTASEDQFDDSAEANKEDFDEEGNSEVEKESSSNADAQKRQKRKRLKSNWASGIIKKKKKKQSSADDTQSQKSTDDDLQSQKSSNSEESSSIHDKGYYLDFSSPKSQKCKLCDYIGTKITTHYVFHHKGSEVLSSRFSPSMATEAIHDAKNNLAKYESHQMAKNSQLSYTCRFCQFQAYAIPTIFYDHLSRHTGEYRHLCPNCHVAYRTNKVLKAHMKTKHLEDKKPIVRKSHDNVILFGYLCGKCNYVQILKENMDKHVKAHHSHDSVVHKINLSTHFDERIETWNHKVNTKESNANTDSSNKKSGDKKVAKSSEPIKKKYPIRTKYTKKDDDSQSSDKDGDDNSSEEEESAPTLQNEQQQVSKVDSFRPVRAKRAAKEKAQEKMKVIMEMGEVPNRKKTSLAENNEDSTNKLEFTPENKKHNTFITKEPMKDASKEIKQSVYTSVTDYEDDDKKNKLIDTVGKDIVKVKKEVEMNVFTCNTDIQEENKKIEQERLQKMEELNRSFGSRTSLNFVDKLCDRLNQSNVTIKDEPQEEFVDTKYHTLSSKSPDISPILEKTATLAADKAPAQSRVSLLESLNSNVAAHTFDVAQKNDKNIMNMIEKLKGNLGVDDNFKLEDQDVDEIDNDSPPPLTYINQIKSQNLPVKTLEICGLLKVVKTEESTTFSCLVPPCVFFTENEQHFHDHCKEGHVSGLWGRSSSLCEMCGMEINKTDDANLLENVYKHLFIHHGDFIKSSSKLQPVPATSMIRLRKLSGDALSLSASLDVEHNDVANVDITNQTSIEQSESAKETDDNPFSFKITDVISLAGCEPQVPEDEDKLQISLNESRAPGLVAEHQPTVIRPTVSLGECQPPPLTPILKVTRPLLVKEAKMSTADILKPKKSTQALNKFIAEVGNLYKCPQFTCTYSTIVRELLEQHLKTHDFDKNEMVPCVYCDLRTPWEHVGVHIDIRHSNCKFTCSYCLYRACAKNYVFLHQDKVHPFQDYSVIVLRAQKNQKKFHIADSKIDLKTLCEPFRCHKACNVQFLFENEFTEHLNQYHYGQRFFTCGHEDCSSRMIISKMVHHWSVAHAVSTYQCAYCKTNSNELKLMYYHLAMSHQHLLPEIFVRIVSPKPNYTLGYNDEAFKRMRKITSLPNILEGWREEKLAVPCHDVTVPVSPVKVASAQSNASNKSPLASTSVKLSPGSTVTATSDGLLLVASKSVGAIKLGSPLGNPLIAVKSPESKLNLSGTNSLLIPSINSNMQTSLLNTAKTIQEESIPSNSGQQLANATITSTATSPSFNTNATSTSSSNLDVSVPARPDDINSNVAPLEHINLHEENNQDYVSESEVDPLDLGDANTFLSLTYSSEDEGDNGKAKKKIGLLGYQLFRCAFCEFSCSNGNDFKKHVTKSSTCRSATNSNRPFECVHCKKAFKHSHVLVEHVHTHGVLRYSCSLCGNKFPTCSQARTHMRSRHSITQTTQTLLNSASTSFSMGNEEFIIKPKLLLDESVAVNETTSDELSADVLNSKNVYNPDEIDKIPIRSIFITNLQCGVCTYATKVRTNLVRHLQFHLQEKAVPVSAPVNPVPCLEKNEKMFDKMVNLASSSHKSGSRMGSSTAKTENKDAVKCPEFVPSHTRYACCAESCNYLCPEEANLRHHLTALHDGETSFVCVHCKVPIVPADAEALIKHLKLHGLQLYKCQYCSFHHNLKHKVERHSNDSHIDLPNKVVTVRNLESETSDDTNSSAPANQNKSSKLWRCLMCKFRGNSEEAIRSHVWDKHEIDSQYKCALCLYKTDDKSTFSSHYNDHHPNYDVHIISSYRQNTEQANKDDKEINNFDTTPLWQRDRPRIKHIRGILFDESVPSSSKSPNKKVGKSSGAAAKNVSKNLDLAIESVAKGDSVLPDPDSKSSNSAKKSEDDEVCELAEGTSDVIVIDDDDDNEGASTASKTAAKPQTKRKRLRLVAVGPKDKLLRLEGSTDVSNGKTNDAKSDNVDVDDDDDESEKSLKLSFGEFGLPLNKQLKCPKCEKFKSKRISDFMFHLFKENRVHRYKCGICGDESITYRYMSKHVKEHGHKFNINDIIPMKKNIRLELWLQMLIKSQCTKIAPILTHIPDASPSDKNKVSCRYCSRWFKSEQDRIEHTLTHWFAMPFKCLECNRTTYNRDQMEKHFAQSHRGVALNFNEVGPTVAKELQHSDYLHMKEVEEQHLFKNNDEEVPIPPSPYADTTGESKQQNSTEAEKPAKAAVPIEKPFKVSDYKVLPVEELVIISKTDSNVPQNGDVYCCDYCAYMSNSEPIMMDHFFEDHQNANVKFKVLNQRICNSKKEDYIGCMFCDEVGSEITIRQHHMNVHEHETFLYYRYTCNICKKKFLKTTGLKLHSQRIHPDAAVTYTDVFNNIITSAAEKVSKEKVQSTNVAAPNRNLLSLLTPAAKIWKRYQCTECSYRRDFPSSSITNVRNHVKTHFKAYACEECGLKFKNKPDALVHFRKDHPDAEECILYDKDVQDSFNECMRIIQSEAIRIENPNTHHISTTSKECATARKSTSAFYYRPLEEFSYYGNPVEKLDMSKIMSTVEINGICMDMTADKLGKLFDLDPIVEVIKMQTSDEESEDVDIVS